MIWVALYIFHSWAGGGEPCDMGYSIHFHSWAGGGEPCDMGYSLFFLTYPPGEDAPHLRPAGKCEYGRQTAMDACFPSLTKRRMPYGTRSVGFHGPSLHGRQTVMGEGCPLLSSRRFPRACSAWTSRPCWVWVAQLCPRAFSDWQMRAGCKWPCLRHARYLQSFFDWEFVSTWEPRKTIHIKACFESLTP